MCVTSTSLILCPGLFYHNGNAINRFCIKQPHGHQRVCTCVRITVSRRRIASFSPSLASSSSKVISTKSTLNSFASTRWTLFIYFFLYSLYWCRTKAKGCTANGQSHKKLATWWRNYWRTLDTRWTGGDYSLLKIANFQGIDWFASHSRCLSLYLLISLCLCLSFLLKLFRTKSSFLVSILETNFYRYKMTAPEN